MDRLMDLKYQRLNQMESMKMQLLLLRFIIFLDQVFPPASKHLQRDHESKFSKINNLIIYNS